MKLKEILEDADLLVPNALTLQQKIRYFNQAQSNVYRDFPAITKSILFYTEPDTTMYTLDVPTDRIKQVVVNDQEYQYRDLSDELGGYVYSFMEGDLFIQPTPTNTLESYILYEAPPEDMTENDLEAEPSFLVDYHELFVLGIAKKLATIEKDYKTAAELESQYVELNHRAVTNLRKGNQKKVRIVRRWG